MGTAGKGSEPMTVTQLHDELAEVERVRSWAES